MNDQNYATAAPETGHLESDLPALWTAIERERAVIVFDAAGFVRRANMRFLELMGFPENELIGQHHRLLCAADYAASAEYRQFWLDLKAGKTVHGEFRRIAKDGRKVWMHATYTPIMDAAGELQKVVKVASDMTEGRQRADDHAGKVAAIDRVQAVAEFDLRGFVLDANAGFLTLMGYALDEINGQHHRMFCESSYTSSDAYRVFWEKLGRGEHDAGQYRRIAKNGGERWIQASYNPVFDGEGRLIKVVKFATDITQYKFRAAEQESQLAAMDRANATIEFDLTGVVLKANQNFLNTMGYLEREIVGQHHKMFCEPAYVASADYRDFWSRLGRGEFDSGRYLRVSKHGYRVWLQATYNPVFDADGKPVKVVKFATDITAEVEREQKVQANVLAMSEKITELSRSITGIAASTKEAASIATETQQEAEEGGAVLNHSIDAIRQIEKSSSAITEIVKLIDDLASQTNMLAFNAAIEAARAGEHGYGFSVVASEVRKLAERSSEATRQINRLIGESIERVEVGSKTSTKAVEGFDRIRSGVDRTSHTIRAIHEVTEQQAVATRTVADLLQELISVGRESGDAAPGVAARDGKPVRV
ncbi:methyl-accepting chemotaxis protein [Paraburkholderia solisilvae]|uniref:Biofilm dispersion protein BdlA n=1 Tax=Paraburkholderia solisilvae TaxID=624376 RepID=A0A6J5DU35_9BURK|nr:PAS domain-containing methyl-accepting chemotaxis protein [Paraburkholderia solisilvae]CAB3757443.1 hypothetical protein LMG29739_02702 [Paraburkholderia solisilvae]